MGENFVMGKEKDLFTRKKIQRCVVMMGKSTPS